MSNETKSIPVTIRMMPSQLDSVKLLAKEHGQSVSQYCVEHIFQNNGVTDTQLRQVFYSLAKIRDAAGFQSETGTSADDLISKECDAVWQFLQS